jgi:CheY-like chemotaxis protein
MQRILVVEHNQSVALTLRDGLERLVDCEVSVAVSGEQALQLVEQGPFDVLITDYKMPGTDGLDLVKRIQALCPHTRVVMVTGYRDDMLWQQPAVGLVWSILDKPVGLDEIRSAVSDALGRHEPAADNGHAGARGSVVPRISRIAVRWEGSSGRETGDDLSASSNSPRGMEAACPRSLESVTLVDADEAPSTRGMHGGVKTSARRQTGARGAEQPD